MPNSQLNIDYLVQSQANKDITLNAAIDALARRSGYVTQSVAGTGTINLSSDVSRYGIIEATGVLTGNRTMNIPASFDHSLIIFNNTTGAFTLSIQWNGGTSIVLPRGCFIPVRKNGAAAAYGFNALNYALPDFVAFRNTSTQSLTPSTDTVIQYNNEERDPSESFDPVTNFRFNCPATGLYEFHAQAEIEVTVAGTGNTNATIAIRKNGTINRRGDLIQGPAASICLQRVSCRTIVSLTAGDNVDVIARQEQVGSTSRINNGADRTFLFGKAIRLG